MSEAVYSLPSELAASANSSWFINLHAAVEQASRLRGSVRDDELM